MKNSYKVQILVKANSDRVPYKNTKKFHNTSLLEIAIQKSLNIFSESDVYLNTNCKQSQKIATQYGINVYKRDDSLCDNDTTLDSIIYNFISNVTCENVILVNTVTPLVESSVLLEMLKSYEKNENLISYLTGNKYKLHAFCAGKSVNFKNEGPIPATQDIEPIWISNWAYGIWNAKKFKTHYEVQEGRAVFCNEIQFFETNPLDAIKVSDQQDFILAEQEYIKRISQV